MKILINVFLLLGEFSLIIQGFNFKTQQICCDIGTNYYYNNNETCKTFNNNNNYNKFPIPGVELKDEKACLNIIDICCRKVFRTKQCNAGKEDAKMGHCPNEDGERKVCCNTCILGIEAQKFGDLCIDTLQLGHPFTECCEQATELIRKTTTTTSTTTSSVKPLTTAKLSSSVHLLPLVGNVPKPPPDEFYPGLSEENVCQTEEFCAQLCEPSGKSYKCRCFPGYELMKDGVSCKPIKHANGSRCQENNPCDHDCVDTGTSILCSCRKGYELAEDKISCKDIDECTLGIHECDPNEECENDEGTYFCFQTDLDTEDEGFGKCPAGHKFNVEKSVCDDIDECEISLICRPPKICKNSIGSFSCIGPVCPEGFYYRNSIEACADIDECLTPENNCNKDSQLCVNTKGNYSCVDKASRQACPPGFKKNEETLLCEDINECEDNNLKVCLIDDGEDGEEEGECFNEIGGYKCIKRKNNKTNESTSTTKTYLPSRPQCSTGFKFNPMKNTCDDINECQLHIDDCSTMHRCDNSIGSFHCTRMVSCGTGYTLNSADDLCEDDDECALGTHNCYSLGPNYVCSNQIGTYRCEAIRPTYYRPFTTSSSTSTTPTSSSSSIQPSSTTKLATSSSSTSISYSSSVNSSTTLKPIPIRNPWGEPFYSERTRRPWYPPMPNHTTVIPTLSSITASSSFVSSSSTLKPIPIRNPWGEPFYSSGTRRPWYLPNHFSSPQFPRFFTDRTQSVIPNNPAHYTPSSSSSSSTSFRPPFSYSTTEKSSQINASFKKCLPGFIMNANGDCEDIDECKSNPCPKTSKCINFNGRFQCSAPLHCKSGYEVNEAGTECIDVDECTRKTHKCFPTQICNNGPGFYNCVCPRGHVLNRNTETCEDIDECKIFKPCGNYVECTNTIGSYECRCQSGYKMEQNYCHDIDECKELTNLCEHTCINLWGSYRCACNLGFILNSDNRTCTDLNECEKFKDRKLCIGNCVNTPGSYACECPNGYKLGNDKRVCIDIDECQHNVCGPQNACVNSNGDYKCYPIICSQNYVKDSNHKALCRRVCDVRDINCLELPITYSFQFTSIVSNLPIDNNMNGILFYTMKGPKNYNDWDLVRTEFTLTLEEVQCPRKFNCFNENYIEKIVYDNKMDIKLIKSIQGPQEIKFKAKMTLLHRNNLKTTAVGYVYVIVSEYPF